MDNLYREALLERLANPVNQGTIFQPELEASLVNPLCGDTVKLELRVKNNIVEQAVYSGNGCAISQVSADLLTEKIQGESLAEIKNISENDILDLVGVAPSPSREKCLVLSLQVLKKALND